MRKTQKKQTENFITLLRTAHTEIKKALESKNPALAMDLLEQCQSGVIELGGTIEAAEGENCVTIPKLENYCEQAYQAYEQVRLLSSVNSHKIIKTLNKSLTQMENSIKQDIPTQIEAVFLPYKASMWDSLESVWRAADEDPNCNAYVIPIPYYDRDPQGNFAQMHYEGDLYPKDVPITRYDEYDFAKRHPDIIFIHNPYDNNNYVTSVHPYFYSDKLKQYTDQLVYIPYFVLGEIDLENEDAVKGMAHFVTTPGVVNADKVIVQSENMRQAYIKAMLMVTGEHTRGYWEGKILGLGSPKFDKVLSTHKENVEVPEEWLKVIEKPDGSWKKIIFYNTSVAALLEHNEKMNAKIKDVLRVFKENREEVALLWRPHPLIEATIKSVRPRLWEEYKEIVEEYRKEGWGIYDDTADMDRAVALSDGYYGDWSSIVHLYRETGKPVMVQDVDSLIENNYSLAMDNIIEYQGEWWFLAMRDNGIYRMKKDSLEATLVKRIPYSDDYNGTHPEYGKIYIFYDKVFVIPMLTKYIAIYDIKKDELRYIEYGNVDFKRGTIFWDGVKYENKLYLIPCAYDSIIGIDLITEKIEKIKINDVASNDSLSTVYAWGSILWNGRNVTFTKMFENKIISIDLETKSKKIYKSEILDEGGSGICRDGNCVWIIPKTTDKIFLYDKNRGDLRTYDQFPNGYKAGNRSFYKIYAMNELYLLPRDANMCIAVNKENGEMRILFQQNENNKKDFFAEYMHYTNIWEDGTRMIIIDSVKGDMFSFEDSRNIKKENVTIIRENEQQRLPLMITEAKNRFGNVEYFIKNSIIDSYSIKNEENFGKIILEKFRR